jgi:hypothetical protein
MTAQWRCEDCSPYSETVREDFDGPAAPSPLAP